MKKILLLLALLWLIPMYSQVTNNNLKIFLDCSYYCDMPYIKQNLKYVEFVRDQKFADVHILFRTQRNGGGGRHYDVEFTGQNEFSELSDVLTFSTKEDDTETEERDLIFKNLKLGLIGYWVKKGMGDKFDLKFKAQPKAAVKIEEDPWNKWVFNMSVRGYFNGQETSKFENVSFSASAKRVTDKNKFYISGSMNNGKSTFTFDGEDIISNNKSTYFYMSDVISINEHWSTGIFARARKSTYNNYAFYASLKPAIEYNYFTYLESSKKQLTLSYRIGGVQNKYEEMTIFGKEEEFVWEHELNLGGVVKQKWGNITGEIAYNSYLHDSELNAFEFYLGTNFRIVKGLSFNISGNYGITNNQINLAAGDLSLEELLLRQQQVKSGYNYFVSTGISYSFGSIYNTIVNPRFNF